jgi:hypothetical protein
MSSIHGCEMCSLEAHFQSREQPKVTRSEIRRVRWLSDDRKDFLGEELLHNKRCVARCVIMMPNDQHSRLTQTEQQRHCTPKPVQTCCTCKQTCWTPYQNNAWAILSLILRLQGNSGNFLIAHRIFHLLPLFPNTLTLLCFQMIYSAYKLPVIISKQLKFSRKQHKFHSSNEHVFTCHMVALPATTSSVACCHPSCTCHYSCDAWLRYRLVELVNVSQNIWDLSPTDPLCLI